MGDNIGTGTVQELPYNMVSFTAQKCHQDPKSHETGEQCTLVVSKDVVSYVRHRLSTWQISLVEKPVNLSSTFKFHFCDLIK